MIDEAQTEPRKAAVQQLHEYEAKLAAAGEEAQKIVVQAQRDAEVIKDQIVAEAQAVAQRERDRAVQDIETAKTRALTRDDTTERRPGRVDGRPLSSGGN